MIPIETHEAAAEEVKRRRAGIDSSRKWGRCGMLPDSFYLELPDEELSEVVEATRKVAVLAAAQTEGNSVGPFR